MVGGLGGCAAVVCARARPLSFLFLFAPVSVRSSCMSDLPTLQAFLPLQCLHPLRLKPQGDGGHQSVSTESNPFKGVPPHPKVRQRNESPALDFQGQDGT